MGKEYEVVHEIFNSCSNNQMRDVYIEELEIEDLETYIRTKHKDKELKIEREDLEDGTVIYPGCCRGIRSQNYKETTWQR